MTEPRTDEGFEDLVAEGATSAEPALAHSVHVDAGDLEPDTEYWYRFTVGDLTSPVGRTRTAPAAGAAVDRLRFAFASCQDQQEGHWTAHQHLAAEDVDLVFFLGDYIYEDDPRTDAIGAIASASPAVYYAEARHRGYVVVEVTPDDLRADCRYVSTTAEPAAELSTGASWRVRAGDPVPQPA